MTEFCSRDLTTIRIPNDPSQGLPDVVIASAYLPGDGDVPTPELAALVEHCEREGLELVVSADTNAHHPLWGSCKANTRDGSSFTPEARELQDMWSRLLQWSCRDECRYHCMWRTTAAFAERNMETPKFHGKWPFQRIYGIQEPASAISSVLNFAANAYMYLKILKDRRFSIKDTKLLLFWHLFAIVCMNAWVWSTIFHTRDTPFTEFMDYACALSMVMGLFVAAIVRVFHGYRRLCGFLLLAALVYYAEHVQYLYMGRIDYDYNMAVNVVCGVMGSCLWMAWSVYHWHRTGSRYVWRMVAFNKLSGAALLLELGDFPPVWRAWDAHALWHLSTAPLPLLFYRCVIDDLEFLQQTTKLPEKTDFKLA